MRVREFELLMKGLLDRAAHPEIDTVETFEEAGFTDKPVGLCVSFTSGAQAFVRSSAHRRQVATTRRLRPTTTVS